MWVAKVCESLGLAVNLKVKLESIGAEVFSASAMTIKYQYVTCFIQRTGIYQSLIMFVQVNNVTNKRDNWGHRKKEFMLLIRLENVTKPSLNSLDSTNPQSDRLCTNGGNSRSNSSYLPEKWLTNKDHSKAGRVIVCEVAKVPRVTSKQLKAFLTLANVNVHEPTTRRALRNHGVYGRVARRKSLFSKIKIAC